MIPKKIHYCWFGGAEIPEKDRRCMDSWKKWCPDYKIIEWNEGNYDVNRCAYMAEAYQEKKWGFVSDFARFDIVFREGGFYLDTDVELIKSLDPLCDQTAYLGFEDARHVNSGIGFGAQAGCALIGGLRDMYFDLSFRREDGTLNLTPTPQYITEYLCGKGLLPDNTMQTVEGVRIYPSEYFSPKDYISGKVKCTDNTISIHHYNASWFNWRQKVIRRVSRLIGENNCLRLLKWRRSLLDRMGKG